MVGLLGPRQSWTQCLRSDGQQCAAPSRSTAGAGTQTYDHQAEFIRTHLALLAATDFLTVEVLTLRGLVTYYVLFFIHLVSRRVDIAGITPHPDESWMEQIARNVTMDGWGILCDCRYLLHDRDTKYRASFLAIMTSGHVKTLRLPARSPNLNAFSERWIRSVKEEYLSKVILFGENSLRRAMREYVAHYHAERNHQGKSNTLLFPRATEARGDGPVECRERLGGLLLPPRRRVNW
jgi:putative transposase